MRHELTWAYYRLISKVVSEQSLHFYRNETIDNQWIIWKFIFSKIKNTASCTYTKRYFYFKKSLELLLRNAMQNIQTFVFCGVVAVFKLNNDPKIGG